MNKFTLKIKNRLLVFPFEKEEEIVRAMVGWKNPYLVEYSLRCRSQAYALLPTSSRYTLLSYGS
jgi:hypothetical protein